MLAALLSAYRRRRLARRFVSCWAQWKRETCFLSSTTMIVSSRSYREIVAMGKPALPLILRALSLQGDHWYLALAEITGENPVPEEDAGKMEAMRSHWLAWGRERGYL